MFVPLFSRDALAAVAGNFESHRVSARRAGLVLSAHMPSQNAAALLPESGKRKAAALEDLLLESAADDEAEPQTTDHDSSRPDRTQL